VTTPASTAAAQQIVDALGCHDLAIVHVTSPIDQFAAWKALLRTITDAAPADVVVNEQAIVFRTPCPKVAVDSIATQHGANHRWLLAIQARYPGRITTTRTGPTTPPR
jgi:hypothetical protein